MMCSTCKREMVSLFLHAKCDWCDFGPEPSQLHKGFIVEPLGFQDGVTYVFQTIEDAERWLTASGRENSCIQQVGGLTPFTWHNSRGTLKDVLLATKVYQVHATHKHVFSATAVHLLGLVAKDGKLLTIQEFTGPVG